MRIPRTYVDAEVAVGERVRVAEEVGHHWRRVLRLRDGANVRVFNGAPGDWEGRMIVVDKRRVDVEITGFSPCEAESPLQLTLVQGISRGQRMDYTLEKAVELGVHRVVPVVMARSHAAPRGDPLTNKQRHWAGVVHAAACQSGRTRLPAVAPVQGFDEWLTGADARASPCLMLAPEGGSGIGAIEAATDITLVAGPEGGFTPAERERGQEAGCRAAHLGPRVFRTETAAVAAMAVLQAHHGDLG